MVKDPTWKLVWLRHRVCLPCTRVREHDWEPDGVNSTGIDYVGLLIHLIIDHTFMILEKARRMGCAQG